MALKQPQIRDLARRMAMLNIEPEHLQKQIAPSLGLGDLSAPTAQAPGIQVAAAGEPWASGPWGSIGPFTPTETSRQQAEQVKENAKTAKPEQGPIVAPPTTAATKASQASPNPAPSLGQLMAPKPSPARTVAPQQAPQATQQQPVPPTPEPFAPPVNPLAPPPAVPPLAPGSQAPEAAGLANAAGPANPGEARVLAEGTGSQKELTDKFVETLKQGYTDEKGVVHRITNPMGIAAAMSTAMHESAFAPANVFGKWDDPSQSGQSGTSGGAMSWRAERYNAMKNFVAQQGGDTIENQAKFFLQENPSLINQLNNSKDAAEAQQYMNNAWKFAGYDKAGGEAADRIATAQKLVPTVQMPGTGMLSSDVNNIPPQQMPNSGLLSQPMNGDGRFTQADVDPTVTTAVPTPEPNPLNQFPPAPAAPEEKDQSWLEGKVATIGKLGQLAQAMKGPALEPPKGTAPAPSQGSFNRDPNALKAMMAMLTNMGQSGGPPTLGQLMGGR